MKHLLLPTKSVLLFAVLLLISLISCTSEEEDVAPVSDEYISFKLNGKEYKGTASSLGDDSYFYMWGVVEITPSEGYSVQIEMDNPKVGTFGASKDKLTASIALIKGTVLNPSIGEYELPPNGTGSLTINKYDMNGYAEGTFSFTAQNANKQQLVVTDGKFKLDLR